MSAVQLASQLAEALRATLPNAPQGQIDALAQTLAAAAEQGLTAEKARRQVAVEDDLQALLARLAGSSVAVGARTINFGAGNQFGDVTIRDVAGRDIVHLNIQQTLVSSEAASDVRGLPNPYLGLQAFTYDERERFSGRELLVRSTVAQLTAPGERRELLFITGASGSGKSSFAQAGLLPALEAHYRQRHTPVGRAVMRPGRQPLPALADALAQLRRGPQEPFELLVPYMADRPWDMPEPGQVGLLVIDQFEELFTQSVAEQRDRLFTLLASLPTFEALRMHIIATLRSDFLPELFEQRQLYIQAKAGVDLYAMRSDELALAIQQPVMVTAPTKRFEPALVERLTRDAAGDATYLPLLQVTLEDLWRRGSLTLAAYGSLTDAIRVRADQVLATALAENTAPERDPTERAIILEIFLDLVEVSLDDNARRDVRRRRILTGLTRGDRIRGLLVNELVQARLLSKAIERRDEAEVEVVDIIHESLISNWNLLRETIAARREQLQRRSRFEAALREWSASGEHDNFLLEGVRLAEAEMLNQQDDVALTGEAAQELLQRSLARREAQHQQELERERALAEEQRRRADIERQRAEEQQRARQSLRRRAIAVALVAILALGAAVAATILGLAAQNNAADANRQRETAVAASAQSQTAEARAEEELRVSDSQRLTMVARSLPEIDQERAMALVAEAVARDDNSQALATFFDLAQRRPAWRSVPLIGHAGEVQDAHFLPDGRHVVTASSDGTARLWDLQGELLATFEGASSQPVALAISPDQLRTAVHMGDREIGLWDAKGHYLFSFEMPGRLIGELQFSPDGQRIATVTNDGYLRLWDLAGQLHWEFDLEDGAFPAASFHGFGPDSGSVILASDGWLYSVSTADRQAVQLDRAAPGASARMISRDGQLAIVIMGFEARLESPSKGVIATLQGHEEHVVSAVFSPDDQTILTAAGDGTARLWDRAGRQLVVLQGHGTALTSAEYSPDGSMIVTASGDRTVRVWDSSGQPLAVLTGHQGAVWHAIFSQDGKWILSVSADSTARLWQPANDFSPALPSHAEPIVAAAFSPDGRTILTASADGAVVIRNPTGEPLRTLADHFVPPGPSPFSPDSKLILISANRLRIYADAGLGEMLAETSAEVFVPLLNITWSPDGAYFVVSEHGNKVTLWSTAGERVAELYGHEGQVNSVGFSRDNALFFTASRDQTLRLWDLSGKHLMTLEGHTSELTAGMFSPDSRQILTASRDSTARLWATDGTGQALLEGHSEPILAASFSPDGERILTSDEEGTARIWDRAGNQVALLIGHEGEVWSAAYSPDGRRIATAAADQTVRLWDRNGQLLAVFPSATSNWVRPSFSPDSQRLLVAASPGLVRSYVVGTQSLLLAAACHLGRDLVAEEVQRYAVAPPLRFSTRGATCPTSGDNP